MRAVVIGDLEVARLTCHALTARGVEVVHLSRSGEAELRRALRAPVDAVAVLLRGDVVVLRYALLVEHLVPGVRLVATVFDRTLADQLRRVVPNSSITSPAECAVPSVIGACLADDVVAVFPHRGTVQRLVRRADGSVEVDDHPAHARRWRRWPSALATQLRPHDDTSRILLFGLVGLVLVLGSDWVLSATLLHEGVIGAFYAATRVVATVGPGDTDPARHPGYVLLASVFMLLTIVLTAAFTAGLVNRLLSPRGLALVGRRTAPRRDHVVVVGLGQVGLRLAIRLRELGIAMIVVERDPTAANLRLAKAAGVPVLAGRADDRSVLQRLRLRHAVALACMGSDDSDNVEVAITALAVDPTLRIVLRAGEDDVVAETRSLFPVGQVRDVHALTAGTVVLDVLGSPPDVVFAADHGVGAWTDGRTELLGPLGRCGCTARP